MYLHLPWKSTKCRKLGKYVYIYIHLTWMYGIYLARFFLKSALKSSQILLLFGELWRKAGLLWQEMDKRMLVRNRILCAMDMHLANLWFDITRIWWSNAAILGMPCRFLNFGRLRMADGERTPKQLKIHVKPPRINQAWFFKAGWWSSWLWLVNLPPVTYISTSEIRPYFCLEGYVRWG